MITGCYWDIREDQLTPEELDVLLQLTIWRISIQLLKMHFRLPTDRKKGPAAVMVKRIDSMFV